MSRKNTVKKEVEEEAKEVKKEDVKDMACGKGKKVKKGKKSKR